MIDTTKLVRRAPRPPAHMLELVDKMLKEGKQVKEIVQTTKASESYVYKRKNAILGPRVRLTPEQKAGVIEALKAGYSATSIARAYNVSRSYVEKRKAEL